MRLCIISPYCRKLPNGARNPKDYPWWPDLVKLLKDRGYRVAQVGIAGEPGIPGVDEHHVGLSLKALADLILKADKCICVDNFFHHLCALSAKSCVVIFGQSDPRIFGYPIHKNVLKDRCYLRGNQFNTWMEATYREDCFANPTEVINALET